MGKAAEKKLILVIVEGQTDAEALQMYLRDVFTDQKVAVAITRGDVTTENGADRSNIRSRVGDVVKRYLAGNRFLKADDLLRVIHLVDTDGAFVPEDAVTEDASLTKPVYSESGIATGSKRGIEARNRQKSKALQALVKTKSVLETVPYRVFFMSCNLEHVLHDRMNCTADEKEMLAIEFAERYSEDAEAFKAFIANSSFSVKGPYAESWCFIEKGVESLRRHTNLGLSWIDGEAGRLPTERVR